MYCDRVERLLKESLVQLFTVTELLLSIFSFSDILDIPRTDRRDYPHLSVVSESDQTSVSGRKM